MFNHSDPEHFSNKIIKPLKIKMFLSVLKFHDLYIYAK